MENYNSTENEQSYHTVLPKPILEENKKNWFRKSIISLVLYAFLFYTIFDKNISYMAALLVVLLIHELGHFFAMRLFNYTNVKLFFIPLLGAYVSGKKNNHLPTTNEYCHISGSTARNHHWIWFIFD